MKCYFIETEEKFVYCVESVEEKYVENVLHAWFKKDGDKYIKEYPNDLPNKEIIKIILNGLVNQCLSQKEIGKNH
jgi:hypothetical protein